MWLALGRLSIRKRMGGARWPGAGPSAAGGTYLLRFASSCGSPYRAGRFKQWLKIKNPAAPAVKREAEEEWR